MEIAGASGGAPALPAPAKDPRGFGAPPIPSASPAALGDAEASVASATVRGSIRSRPARRLRPELVPQPGVVAGLFDAASIKRDFPILSERWGSWSSLLIWLDNAATTQKPRAVIDRFTYYYEHEQNSNVHRAAHALAARATRRL